MLPSGAQQLPSLTEFVNDEMHVLSAYDKVFLNEKLSQFNRDTSIQMAIAILPGPPGETLEQFTIDVADKASIGQAATDDGLILFVFPQQRSARLEIGYGIESALPDVLAYRLLTDVLKPAWSHGDYAEGLADTVDAVIKVSHAQFKAGQGPDRFERLIRTFGIGSIKVARMAWPVLRQVSLGHQVISSFFACLLLVGLASGVRQLFLLLRNAGIFFGNLLSGRVLDSGTTRINLKDISDSVLLLLPLILAIVAAAGVVLLAGGGAFGGGGATVHF